MTLWCNHRGEPVRPADHCYAWTECERYEAPDDPRTCGTCAHLDRPKPEPISYCPDCGRHVETT